jgi:hypothetical protein
VTYFNQQNELIRQNKIKGEEVIVSALMINKYVRPYLLRRAQLTSQHSGWYDPLIQNQAYVDFATNAPGYGQLQSDEVIQQLNSAFFSAGGCQDQEKACFAAGDTTASNQVCRDADNFCVRNLPSSILIYADRIYLTVRSKTCLFLQSATATLMT